MKKLLAVGYVTWFWLGCIPPLLTKGSASIYATFLTLPLWYAFVRSTPLWSSLLRLGVVVAVALVIYLVALAALPTGSATLAPWVRKYRPNRRESKKLDWDQYEIVVDEAFGYTICCWPLTIFHYDHIFITMVIGAVAFHCIDGLKIPPASYFDKTYSASGVMLDDLSAGLYASVIVALLCIWM